MFEKLTNLKVSILRSTLTIPFLAIIFISAWIIILCYANNNGISLREQNIVYLKELPQEKQLEILKMCYTSYELNCNDAVFDYKKING